MAQLNSKSDPDQDYRRKLLSAARDGQPMANAELEKEYHVRVYSEAERSALYYEAFPQVGKRASRRQRAEWMQIDDVAISDEANLPTDRSL